MDSMDTRRLPIVGIEEHDREHREILEIIDAVRTTLRARGSDATKRRVVRAALDSVVTYMRNHFAVEENLMRESAYPGYAKHKAEHESFLSKVQVMQGKMHVVSMMPSIESLNLLSNWLHHHILESDKPLLPHLVKTAIVDQSLSIGDKPCTPPTVPARTKRAHLRGNDARDLLGGAAEL